MIRLNEISRNPDDHHEKHFLYPCSFYASKSPSHITTVLGTCVSVCLWDSKLKIGAINHYMMPLWNGEGLASPKFGNIAIDRIIKRMIGLGSTKSSLQAKIFGGKNETDGKASHYKIGARNAEVAISTLEEEGIFITASSLGGEYGRRLQFYTDTGDVYINFIKLNNQ